MKYVVTDEADGVRVAPEGELDMKVAPELRKVLHKAVAGGKRQLTVDLSRVPFIDSSGIATIVEALKLLRKRQGTVKVVGSSSTIRDTFEIAGLTRILGIE
jgi:anti-sigma B factor antagonist